MKNPPEFYDDKYLAGDMERTSPGQKRDEENGIHFGAAVTADEIAKITGARRVLEVGCGIGYVVRRLRELGYEADGIEYSRAAVARSVCGATWGDLTERIAPAVTPPYDLVVCLGVLSHIPIHDLQHALLELRRLTKQGGDLWTNILVKWHETQRHHKTFSPPGAWRIRFEAAGWIDATPDVFGPLLISRGMNRDEYQWSHIWRRR